METIVGSRNVDAIIQQAFDGNGYLIVGPSFFGEPKNNHQQIVDKINLFKKIAKKWEECISSRKSNK